MVRSYTHFALKKKKIEQRHITQKVPTYSKSTSMHARQLNARIELQV